MDGSHGQRQNKLRRNQLKGLCRGGGLGVMAVFTGLVQEGTKLTLKALRGIRGGQGVPHLFPLTSG